MMKRLVEVLAPLLAYFAVATLLAQVLLLGVAIWKWDLRRDRVVQILALAQGVDLFAIQEGALAKVEDLVIEQVSFDEIRATRALKYRNLEYREQSLANRLAQLQTERQNLAEDRRRFTLARETFQTELQEIREGALADGLDEVRRILETIRPAQAKAQLMEMLNDEQIDTVVMLLAEMPDQRRSKIIGEFKTPQEQATVAEVLRRILEGVPVGELATATQENL